MDKRFILITGHPGSGTTFLAALLKELGYDLGDDTDIDNIPNREAGKQVRGMEHRPLYKLCMSWNMRYFPGHFAKASRKAISKSCSALAVDDPMLADQVRERVAQVSEGLPEVVKNPTMSRWLALWLMAGGKRPDFTIVCMRNTLEVSISNEKVAFGGGTPNERRVDTLFNYGFLLETLVLENLDWAPVAYPWSVEQFQHVWDTLPFLREDHNLSQYCAAWLKIADSSLIHIGPDEVEEFRCSQSVGPQVSIEDLPIEEVIKI